MRYFMRDEDSDELYEVDDEGKEVFADTSDDDDLELDTDEDEGEEYDESDPTDLADDLDDIISKAGKAGVSANTMMRLRAAATALRSEVSRLGAVNASESDWGAGDYLSPRRRGGAYTRQQEAAMGDMHTPIADKYARKLHNMPLSALAGTGQHEKVRALYDIASDELRRKER
jgi:hypothetical protein